MMLDSLFIQGKLHSPYFIFVRAGDRWSDAHLLNHFGLSGYRPTQSLKHFSRYAVFADDGQWTMIADDRFYTLWHMPSTRPSLEALGMSYDVFACSVGDCDQSFDFVYYSGGRLIRRYVVADPDFSGGSVVENTGSPLPGETTALRETNELKQVLGIAASLGIRIDYTQRDIRVYSPFKIWQRGFWTRTRRSASVQITESGDV
jgi:hypothetical protein